MRVTANAHTLAPAKLVVGSEAGSLVDVVGVKGQSERGGVSQQTHGASHVMLMSRRRATESPLTLSSAADHPRSNVSQLDVVAL